jgi:hypothetical protein
VLVLIQIYLWYMGYKKKGVHIDDITKKFTTEEVRLFMSTDTYYYSNTHALFDFNMYPVFRFYFKKRLVIEEFVNHLLRVRVNLTPLYILIMFSICKHKLISTLAQERYQPAFAHTA